MKTLLRLVGLGGGILVALFKVGSPDPYHLAVTIPGLVLAGALALLLEFSHERTIKSALRESSDQSVEEIRDGYAEHVVVSIVWAFVLAAIVAGCSYGLATALQPTKFYDMFYDRGYESFKHDLSLMDTPERQIQAIEKRLELQNTPETQHADLVGMKYSLLVSWGKQLDAAGQHDEAKQKWQQAIDWGKQKKNNIPTGEAEALLRGTVLVTAVPTQIPARRALPSKSVVQVVNVQKNTNTLFLDLSIQQPNGDPIGDLLPSDFAVWVNGNLVPVHNVAVQSYANIVSDRYVDLVIDRSGSMKGQAIENARQGASLIAKSLRDNDKVRLITIATNVNVSKWMTPSEALATIATIEPESGGSTSFRDGLAAAMKNVPGKPHLVIGMTDGTDNASSTTPNDLVKDYGGTDTQLITIALQSDQFKPDALRTLTQEVGGEFVLSNVASLVSTYEAIARQTTSQYRITVFLPGEDAKSFKLFAGDSPAVEQILP
jgi:uncharacterized protein YegL